jgi:hypothetical protein
VVGIIAAVLFWIQPLLVVREWGCPLADGWLFFPDDALSPVKCLLDG